MKRQLEFRQWLVNEGLWDATVVGWTAFKKEFVRPKTQAFEAQINGVATATDALFAIDKYYRVIQPSVDAQTAKRLEQRLESAVQKLGYHVSPKQLFELKPERSSHVRKEQISKQDQGHQATR